MFVNFFNSFLFRAISIHQTYFNKDFGGLIRIFVPKFAKKDI
jgi:hypothetical protein